jgi:hypothetical protein
VCVCVCVVCAGDKPLHVACALKPLHFLFSKFLDITLECVNGHGGTCALD